MAPLGILQLAAYLEQHGHPCAVYDCLGPGAPASLAANTEIILATNPKLVGFSATTSSFMAAFELAARIKASRPAVQIVFGNVHVSAIGGELLRHFPEIDYLCLGEGEGTLLDLAEQRDLREIANLCYRSGEDIVVNPRRQRILDLDDLPFPAYEKLAGFPRGYHLPLFSSIKRYGATMVTSRGCPYTCSFCDRTVFERWYRTNSAAYVYEHMKYLRDRFGVHHINFYDDLFTAQRERVTALCEQLIAQPLGMNFNCAVRTGHTSDALLRLLQRAGAVMVSMGIESAAPGMMERHKAGVSLDAVRQTVEQIHAAGLRAKGLFIFGLPGETPETIAATSDFMLSLGLDDMNMSKFSPLYGAPIWDECVGGESGEFNEDWRLMNCLNFAYLPKGFASRAQMDALYNTLVRRFYDSKGFRRRFARRLWQHRWSLWQVLKNLPKTIQAARYFNRSKADLERVGPVFAPHPRQPRGLTPSLSPELVADGLAAVGQIEVSRRPAA
ncbi:radical SAM protein [uncultured Thiodictyon sp.]|uniref:B12-binding domain-containing radical SAM protein n=1 Tax=uncultured Thiodictyon sp. TaxID=1846217 RepID=UPI0025CE5337|nr:radical SAM protein [uncultured Thiodictyon sp.]